MTAKPAVVDSGITAATCHRQVGLVLQKGKDLRAGCRFALRVVRTPEEFKEMERERVEKGVEWARYEMPAPDELDLDLAAYPGLVQAPPVQAEEKTAAGKGDDDPARRLPGIAAAAAPEAGSGDGGKGGGGADDDADDVDLSSLWVALQGWVKHDVGDAEVRLQPRGADAGTTLVAAGRAATAAAPGAGADAEGMQDDSTDLAAEAVAAADAAAAAAKVAAAARPLPALEDEVTEALKFEQEKLKKKTEDNRKIIDAMLSVLKPMVTDASSFA